MGYIFVSGEEVQIGTHGATDYFYASGEPVNNSGSSDYVFESGVGVGGAGWEGYTFCAGFGGNCDFSGGEFRIGSDPLLSFNHDGRNTDDTADLQNNAFWATRRKESLPSPPWTVTFKGVDYSNQYSANNWSFGVTTAGVGTRPFTDTQSAYFSHQETDTGLSNPPDQFIAATLEGNSQSLSIPSYPSDFSISWDGSTFTYAVNGSSVASLSGSSGTYHPAANLEDDGSNTIGDAATVASVEIT